ncbi:hypothetical protein AZF37_04685 [endosymbiont 'TC1' of Trimyema compressum]|uniref:segregation and condensation protein A n=1 Tax=endosymbiont 'TC1' of Trimyema compressum TaxID=243899 RepID=UPI0007F11C2A|nr:segregation/condensation protein A [endosymbiont 'TC1' of Trimyema compressum]AMP20561.1 hypothetical protein AZF37_04685 [endosymbiont 'TC1' of Trimyema compressum]
MDYNIHLQAFDGPLDLLLHLIQKDKVNIYDIPIASITNQYLAYLKGMEKFNIEVASEFLLIASTLISIKVKMLLPKEINEETGEEDPRLELVERLLEYERYKIATAIFRELIENQGKSYFRPKDEKLYETIAKDVNPLADVLPEDLYNLITFALSRVEEKKMKPYKVQAKQITITEKINSLLKLLYEKKSIYFHDMIDEVSKSDIVVSFLALLDLFRQEKVSFLQEANFSPVKIILKEGA